MNVPLLSPVAVGDTVMYSDNEDGSGCGNNLTEAILEISGNTYRIIDASTWINDNQIIGITAKA